MMDWFREGGYPMWLLLVTALASGGFALGRGKRGRAFALFVGMQLVIVEGIFGLSTGMIAVSRAVATFPDPARAIGVGLGELANNGTFSAALALALGLAALACRHAERNDTAGP